MDKGWLQKIKVGDMVVIAGGNSWTPPSVVKVERLTKTQIVVVGSDIKYRRNNGRAIGGCAWSTTWVREATIEKIAEIGQAQAKRKAINYLGDMSWSNLPLESLQVIVETVRQQIESNKNG